MTGPREDAAPFPSEIVERLRAGFAEGRTRPLAWRRQQLRAIEALVTECEPQLVQALQRDLGRGAVDSWLADLAPVAAEARHAGRRLRAWTRPKRVGVPLSVRPARARHEAEPLGVVLIVAPWNYPVQLLLAPLVGAVAAGNCVILKPSERTPVTSKLLADLVRRYLDPAAVTVVEGAAETTLALIEQGLDHCLFTGSPEVGRLVMAAAAKHLTPVTLELGGKNPVLVARDADLPVTARRIAWAKMFNSGQTCIAPDYVLVESTVRDTLVEHLRIAIDAMSESADVALIDERQAERIAGLISDSGGRIAHGGQVDTGNHRAQVTVIVDPDADSPLMAEEIFGPILPVISVESLDTAVARVNRDAKPLALYVFTRSRATARSVLHATSSGTAGVNHVMYQLLVPGLPFGGVGRSGTGSYHGKWGFDTFCHRKAILTKPTWVDPSIAYPPYTALKRRVLRALF